MNTTKTAQFTPGLWVPYNSDKGRIFSHWYIRVDGGPSIVTVHNGLPDNQDMANANLIAAAPVMYEACQWALSTLTDNDDDALNETDKATIELLRQALAQVEGK